MGDRISAFKSGKINRDNKRVVKRVSGAGVLSFIYHGLPRQVDYLLKVRNVSIIASFALEMIRGHGGVG